MRDILDACDFIKEWQPEVVFHLAAQSVVTNHDDLETYGTNVVGTFNLLHACQQYAPRLRSFVHVSTDKVYGTNAAARRTDPLRGIGDPYTASKHSGDIIAQGYRAFYKMPIHIVRTGNIYGPGDTHFDRIVPGIIKDTLAGKPRMHRGDHRFIRDFIYIGDLIPAYLRIADEEPGIYNLGGDFCSLGDLAALIARLMGREDLVPVWMNTQRNEIPFQHVVDCPDWWRPQTSLEEGLRRTIEWYSSQA